METKELVTKIEYDNLMSQIEEILLKATQLGGFGELTKAEKLKLSTLSLKAEQYEDSIPLMPIKTPKSISEMLRYKMYENGWRQKQLASVLEISEATISGLLSGRRKLSIELAKKLHTKLGIDAQFLLMSV